MSLKSLAFVLRSLGSTVEKLCEAQDGCGCVGVHVTGDLSEQGSHDVKAGGRRVSYARKMSCVRSRVVESQRSVHSAQATCDVPTPSFFLVAEFFRVCPEELVVLSPVTTREADDDRKEC